MEGVPRTEGEPPARPKLEVDLTTWDGHWFNLVTAALARLEGEALKAFNRDVGELLWRSSVATYNDLFQTINTHLDLIDTSGALAAYAPNPSDGQAGGRDTPPQAPLNAQNQTGEATLC